MRPPKPDAGTPAVVPEARLRRDGAGVVKPIKRDALHGLRGP